MKKTLLSLALILSLLTNVAIAQETDSLEADVEEKLQTFYKGVGEAITINNTTLLKACYPTIIEITEFAEASNFSFTGEFEIDAFMKQIEKRFKKYQGKKLSYLCKFNCFRFTQKKRV